MRDNVDLKNIDHVLHVLRNPFGWNEHIVREARYAAANEIERLQKELAKCKEAKGHV